MNKFTCHDCSKKLKENEEYMPYQVGDKTYIKCKECHQKDPVLKNYQPTEVYSRVVGYIRPVSQWNKGKQAEFGDRKEYDANSGCDCDCK